MLVIVKLYAQSSNIPFAITLAQLKLNSRISKGSMMKASVPDTFIGLSAFKESKRVSEELLCQAKRN